MPRGERPLDDGDSPLLRFARDLRQLRADAGGPTYRDLARRAHFSVTTLSEAAAGRKLPSLDVTLAYVRGCGGSEDVWARRWHEVAASQAEANDSPSPYVGLSAFTREDAGLFFGREKLTATLRHRLERQDFLAVFGASGEGKSSLLRAGLAKHFDRAVTCTPGADPDAAIADALAKSPDLLIVDQFEELFTLCDDPVQRDAFLTALLTARCKVVIAVRSDFYPHCAAHPDLAEALTDAQVLIGTMTPDELRRAVVAPAAKMSCTVDGGLVTTLVAEAAGRSGVLPLVSHALLESWRRKKGSILTLGAYEEAGGIHGALAQSAEAAYAQLSEDQQEMARQLLLRLSADGTKRPVPRSEVVGEEVLQVLADARLITVGADTVEVTHEALFRAWPRLQVWLDEDREGLRTHHRLTEAARLWEELGRDTGALYRSTRLAEASEWVDRTGPILATAEQAFLNSSRNVARRRTRRSRLITAGLVALLVATAYSAVTASRQREEVQRLLLIANSQQQAMVSAALYNGDPDEAAKMAVSAYRTYPSVEARGQVLSTAARHPRRTDSRFTDIRFGKGVIGLAAGQDVHLLDANTFELVKKIRTRRLIDVDLDREGRIALSEVKGRVTVRQTPDAEPVVLRERGAEGPVRFTGHGLFAGGQLWDLTTHELRAELPIAPITTPFDIHGDTLAVVEGDGVSLWSLATAQRIGGFGSGVTKVRLARGNRAVVSTTDSVALWDTASRTQIAALPTVSPTTELEIDDEGTLAAFRGNNYAEVLLWDLVHNTALPSLSAPSAGSFAFTPDGDLMIQRPKATRIWTRGSLPFAQDNPVRALAVEPNGTIVTFDNRGVIKRHDATLRVLSQVETGATARNLADFSRDGRRLVTGSADEPLAVRDTTDGRLTGTLVARNAARPPTSATFADDHDVVVAGGEGHAETWPATANLLDTRNNGVLTAVAFGKNDHEVMLGSERGEVFVGDTGAWVPRGLGSNHRGPVRALAVSPDKRWLASGGDDGLITLWRTSTWQKMGELRGHNGPVNTLEFSPDSTRLASGGTDKKVIIWNRLGQKIWAPLTGHTQSVTHVAWMPDGQGVVSAGSDALLVWQLDVESALRALS
ncbi:helix-turn-helix domain-containing protein [Lentzea sp. NPDC051213]|uniref:nSTAND1 domain-containing NTPase n=1 Tax=Lentzea sp. NPDC051213 TaxID=3364126 RepID=UPI0037925D49